MKHILSLTASLLILAAPFAFADEKAIIKEIPVSKFTVVECTLPCDIKYTQGSESFKISAPQNVLDHLVVAVNEGKMKICLDKTKLFNFEDVKVWVSSKMLSEIIINGTIDFEAESGIKTDTFKANLNGASDLKIVGLYAKSASITSNGSAEIDIENAYCGKLETKINGTGDCEIEGLECEKLEVTVNGAGGSKIEGHAKEAKLTINGVGGINAKKLKADFMSTAVNGIGSISRE